MSDTRSFISAGIINLGLTGWGMHGTERPARKGSPFGNEG